MTAVFIQGVPWHSIRALNAAHLAKQTGGTIVWDETHSGFDTWLKVLEAIGEEAAITLEDDVILASQWRAKIEGAIEMHPDQVIRFFSLDEKDLELGPRSMRASSFYLNQCVYWPPTYARALREWIGERRDEDFVKTHDHIVGRWLSERRERYWLEVPSLVQHRGELRSTISAHRRTGRVSPTFEGAAS